jgi:hypothetical protein
MIKKIKKATKSASRQTIYSILSQDKYEANLVAFYVLQQITVNKNSIFVDDLAI